MKYKGNKHLPVVDISAYGARGDSRTSLGRDCTSAVQAAVDELIERGGSGILFAPQGRYRITDTIDFSQLRSFWFLGSGGSCDLQSYNRNFPEVDSTFVWDGDAGGTMFRMDGKSFQISNIGVWGKFPGAATRAGKGIHLGYTAGIGSGQSSIDSLHMSDLDSCFYCGTSPTGANCAGLRFGYVSFFDCTNGLHVINNQGVEYVFDFACLDHCDNGFYFEAGGGLKVTHLQSTYTQNVLHLDGVGSDIGTNNGYYYIDDVRIDNNQTVTTKLLKVSQTPTAKVVFGGGGYGHTVHAIDGTPIFELDSGIVSCIVRDMDGAMSGTLPIASVGSTCYFEMDGCHVNGGTWTDVSPEFITGTGKWIARNCFTKDGSTTRRMLPTIGNDPYGKHGTYNQNQQSGTSYTLAITDVGKVVECANASPIAIDVPAESTTNFPLGSEIDIIQTGAGQVTLTPDTGVTINSPNGLKTSAQWGRIRLIKRGTNLWHASGDVTP